MNQFLLIQQTPPKIIGLSAVAGSGQVTLNWNNGVAGATYNSYYSTGSIGPWIPWSTGLAVTTDTVTGLTNGTIYWFTVTEVVGALESVKCPAVSAMPGSLLILDHFTDPDDTLITAHTPDVDATGRVLVNIDNVNCIDYAGTNGTGTYWGLGCYSNNYNYPMKMDDFTVTG